MVASVTSALASIPSSFVPSVATSRPSTVPVAVMFPVTSIPAPKSTLPTNAPPLLLLTISAVVNDLNATILISSPTAAATAKTTLVPLVAV